MNWLNRAMRFVLRGGGVAALWTIAAATPAAERGSAWTWFSASDQDAGVAGERGLAVYQNHCLMCHGSGSGRVGTQGLQIKYNGELPAVLDERTDLTPDVVKFSVRNGVLTMPWFRTTELSDADLEALAAYLSRTRQPRRVTAPS